MKYRCQGGTLLPRFKNNQGFLSVTGKPENEDRSLTLLGESEQSSLGANWLYIRGISNKCFSDEDENVMFRGGVPKRWMSEKAAMEYPNVRRDDTVEELYGIKVHYHLVMVYLQGLEYFCVILNVCILSLGDH
ncbi:hypothetical protein E2C01_091254 [Portunus trituberculatus]|uniref:Uncharacterized protein n=1 Tax=Portunus trituberculatus TaxID=210409 RepID=A0A5B7JMH2_PORTR|nr:hypothetical protein [Portunus trituberculatus]